MHRPTLVPVDTCINVCVTADGHASHVIIAQNPVYICPLLGVVPSMGLTNAGATVVPDMRFHCPENPVLRPLPFPPTLVTTDPGTVSTALRFPERGTIGVLQCHCIYGCSLPWPFLTSAFSLMVVCTVALPVSCGGSPDDECACRQNLADGTSELVFSVHPWQAVVSGTPSLRDGPGPRLSLPIPGLGSDSAC